MLVNKRHTGASFPKAPEIVQLYHHNGQSASSWYIHIPEVNIKGKNLIAIDHISNSIRATTCFWPYRGEAALWKMFAQPTKWLSIWGGHL